MALTRDQMIDYIDQVFDWFVTKGNKQSIKDGLCVYHGPNGAHCAFAVIVPEEFRKYLVEMHSPKLLFKEIEGLREAMGNPSKEQMDFFQYLQDCHDCMADTNINFSLNDLKERVLKGDFDPNESC